MSALDDWLAQAAASGWQNLPNNITWPVGASTGQTRIVVGADTPDILQSYGVLVAILFYITDAQSGLEIGYGFIGSTNSIDFSADGNAVLIGHVLYPIPGDPDSPTVANVLTHQQFNLDEGEDFPAFGASTRFKDMQLIVNDTVPRVDIYSPIVRIHGGQFFQAADMIYDGWPILSERPILKSSSQGTALVTPLEEYDTEMYWTDLPDGLYEVKYDLRLSGPAAAAGVVTRIGTKWETVGTVTGNAKDWIGPPDTTVAATIAFPGDMNMSSFASVHAQSARHGVNTIATRTIQHGWVRFASGVGIDNELYLKFYRESAAAPAGNVNILAGSSMWIKRWE